MITILLVAAALFFHEHLIQHPPLKRIVYIAIPSSALHATLSPPDASPFIKYANAFLSVAYVIRAVELLLVYDLRQLKRAETASSSTYVWHPIPTSLSLARLRYTTDLLLNPRGIGWSYAPAYSPPQADSNNASTRAFVLKHPFKLFTTYLLFDFHQATFGRNFPSVAVAIQTAASRVGIQLTPATTADLARHYLLGPACWLAAYAFIDGCHALVAVVHGVLRASTPASEPWTWMYPPLFRSPRAMLTCRLRDIWGRMWHDLCRRPLLATSLLLVPGGISGTVKRLLVLLVSFAVSGCVHAAGAYAVSGDAYGAGVMVVFFIVMAGCIVLQEVLALGVQRALGGWGCVGGMVRWCCDAIVLMAWAYWTCPWFIQYSMMPEAIASVPVFDTWGRMYNFCVTSAMCILYDCKCY